MPGSVLGPGTMRVLETEGLDLKPGTAPPRFCNTPGSSLGTQSPHLQNGNSNTCPEGALRGLNQTLDQTLDQTGAVSLQVWGHQRHLGSLSDGKSPGTTPEGRSSCGLWVPGGGCVFNKHPPLITLRNGCGRKIPSQWFPSPLCLP